MEEKRRYMEVIMTEEPEAESQPTAGTESGEGSEPAKEEA
jgi:hypothetical protein